MKKSQAYIEDNSLIVEGLIEFKRIYVYDVDGNVLFRDVADAGIIKIPVPEKGVFFFRIDDEVTLIKNRKIV